MRVSHFDHHAMALPEEFKVRRIKTINELSTVTREVVEAARDCLVIGTA